MLSWIFRCSVCISQQAEVIRNGTNFVVGHYCGEMGQDFWDARRWQREFDTRDVHFLHLTFDIFQNRSKYFEFILVYLLVYLVVL